MIDTFVMRRPKKTGSCPQYVIPKLGFDGTNVDVENTYTGDFAFAPQMATFNAVKRMRRPALNDLIQPPRDYVPLKSAQMGSHAEGSALFNAPIMPDHAKLKTPEDYVRQVRNTDYLTEHFPSIPPDIMYKKGIRPYPPRPIKYDEVYEPRGMVYKIASTGFDRSNEPSVSQRGDGTDELRAMMSRA